MKETRRSLLRNLSKISATAGFILLWGWASTGDTRMALQYADPDTCSITEDDLISEKNENILGIAGVGLTIAGALGLGKTEKQR